MDLNVLAERLKALRIERGLTLRELGAKSGVNYSMIGHIEHGRRNPTLDVLSRIAAALDVSIDVIFEGQVAGPRTSVLDRFRAVLPHIPQDELDVFIHELALWERRYKPESA